MSRGPYVQTLTGRCWHFTRPLPEDVAFDDLRALTRVTRYGGHTDSHCELYSVAEHSVRVARFVADAGPRVQLAALLHDGGEAYPPADLSGPMVRHLERLEAERRKVDPEFEDETLRIRRLAEVAVWERFGVLEVFRDPEAAALIHRADRTLLATERRDLVAASAVVWGALPDPLPEVIEPWSSARAGAEFCRMFKSLGGQP